ncbi:MAG: hypothetical protein M3292_05490, partial [Actinomycetota bacterium]|nr:hypothetical protein [Actinomycetota bacterium]
MSPISKRALRALGLVVALVALTVVPAAIAGDAEAEVLGQLPEIDAPAANETPEAWFVQLA